jgi:hypothetical protein
MRSIPLLLLSLSLFAEEKPAGVIIHETGAHEPLAQGLAFFHGSWKFADGAMLGEQVPTEKHTATIKILTAFDQIKAEWKMKFLDPKENFLFVSWPADSGAHAMDFTFLPDSGKFELIRPAYKDLKREVLAKGQLTDLTKDWHEVVCIHDGAKFTLTIDGVTISASDEAFNRPMGPFYLNGGGFNGARYLVKDLKVTALPGSPQTRAFIPLKAAAPAPKKK